MTREDILTTLGRSVAGRLREAPPSWTAGCAAASMKHGRAVSGRGTPDAASRIEDPWSTPAT